MKNIRTLALALAAITLLPALAAAGIVNPILDFGPSYAKETGRSAGDHGSANGASLTIVGHVVIFNEPFDDLDPNDPGKEYTYIMEATSGGSSSSPAGPYTFYSTTYSNATFRVYCDAAQNADFADESTFTDGDMILSGDMTNLVITSNDVGTGCAGDQNADIAFTGGSLFSRMSDNGVGFPGINTGLFSICASQVPAAQQAQGYFGLSNTKFDVDPAVPTTQDSWGAIKSQY